MFYGVCRTGNDALRFTTRTKAWMCVYVKIDDNTCLSTIKPNITSNNYPNIFEIQISLIFLNYLCIRTNNNLSLIYYLCTYNWIVQPSLALKCNIFLLLKFKFSFNYHPGIDWEKLFYALRAPIVLLLLMPSIFIIWCTIKTIIIVYITSLLF